MKLPAINLGFTGILGIAAVLGLVALGIFAYFKRDQIISAINPLDKENLANKAATALVTETTGREETLGGLFAEWFNPATRELARLNKQRSEENPTP